MKISDLQPTNVFKFFELISSVPHGSDNTSKISELCCNFARERGLDYIQDDIGNVIMDPAIGIQVSEVVRCTEHRLPALAVVG